MGNRRTKTVCTIGPASGDEQTVQALIEAGMNIARLNLSHGTHAEHRQWFSTVRNCAEAAGRNTAIMLDLQGPKIRVSNCQDDVPITLEQGAEVFVSATCIASTHERIGTTYPQLTEDVNVGERILLADGMLEFCVLEAPRGELRCKVVRGGVLRPRAGINLPDSQVQSPALTEKDKEDVLFGVGLGADLFALSFVRHPDNVHELRQRIAEAGGTAGIVSKMECREALAHFPEIVHHSDGVMVARGDLGVEMAFHEVPLLQKRLIRICNAFGVPVITATQMLESMTCSDTPTRAEAADVANAIIDGTDAVMLSGETAIGQHPVLACEVMCRIAEEVDTEIIGQGRMTMPSNGDKEKKPASLDESGLTVGMDVFVDAIGMSIKHMTTTAAIKAVVCLTQSGYTAASVARHRIDVPILAVTPSEVTQRRCELLWGTDAFSGPDTDIPEKALSFCDALLKREKIACDGDVVLLVAGASQGGNERAHSLRLHTVGEDGRVA